MAITCTPTIKILDAATKRVSISCDMQVDDSEIINVTIAEAVVGTAEEKTEVANIIWKKFLYKYNKQILKDNYASEVATLEAALKANIEGRTI